MNRAALSDIWEVGDWHDIEDSPDVVGGIALKLEAELATDPGVCPITANEELGFDRFDLVDSRTSFCGTNEIIGIVSREITPEKSVTDGRLFAIG